MESCCKLLLIEGALEEDSLFPLHAHLVVSSKAYFSLLSQGYPLPEV